MPKDQIGLFIEECRGEVKGPIGLLGNEGVMPKDQLGLLRNVGVKSKDQLVIGE